MCDEEIIQKKNEEIRALREINILAMKYIKALQSRCIILESAYDELILQRMGVKK